MRPAIGGERGCHDHLCGMGRLYQSQGKSRLARVWATGDIFLHPIYLRAMALVGYFRIGGHDLALFDLVYDVREIADVLFDNRFLD